MVTDLGPRESRGSQDGPLRGSASGRGEGWVDGGKFYPEHVLRITGYIVIPVQRWLGAGLESLGYSVVTNQICYIQGPGRTCPFPSSGSLLMSAGTLEWGFCRTCSWQLSPSPSIISALSCPSVFLTVLFGVTLG